MEIIKKIPTNTFQIYVNDVENPKFLLFSQRGYYNYNNGQIYPYLNMHGEINLCESNYIYVFRMKFKVISVNWKGFFIISEKDNEDYKIDTSVGIRYDLPAMPKFSSNDFYTFFDQIQQRNIQMDSDGYFECNLRTIKRNTNKFVTFKEEDQQ